MAVARPLQEEAWGSCPHTPVMITIKQVLARGIRCGACIWYGKVSDAKYGAGAIPVCPECGSAHIVPTFLCEECGGRGVQMTSAAMGYKDGPCKDCSGTGIDRRFAQQVAALLSSAMEKV